MSEDEIKCDCNLCRGERKRIEGMDRQMMVEVGTHIFVKREDLQILYNIILRNGFMDFEEKKWFERIKEEYNL